MHYLIDLIYLIQFLFYLIVSEALEWIGGKPLPKHIQKRLGSCNTHHPYHIYIYVSDEPHRPTQAAPSKA